VLLVNEFKDEISKSELIEENVMYRPLLKEYTGSFSLLIHFVLVD